MIEHAWRNGARFDAWTEMSEERAWQTRSPPKAPRSMPRQRASSANGTTLPWDNVQSGVSNEFLLDEWRQSKAEPRDGRLSLGRLHRLWRLLRPRP